MRFSGAILSNEGIVAEERFAVSGPWSVECDLGCNDSFQQASQTDDGPLTTRNPPSIIRRETKHRPTTFAGGDDDRQAHHG
jgi:hypothetical protein